MQKAIAKMREEGKSAMDGLRARYKSDLDIADLQQYYSLEQLFDLDKAFNQVPIQLGQNVQSALIFEQLCMQLMNVEGVSV